MVGNTVLYICWLPFIDIFFFKTCVFVVVIFVFQTIFQPLPLSFSLTPKLPLIKSESQPPLHPSCPSVTSKSTASEPPLDFSSPAEFTPSLDTSAARHRVSIKPRNQRASTKTRAQTVSERVCLISYISKQKRKGSIFWNSVSRDRVILRLICPPETTLSTLTTLSLCKRKMFLWRRRCLTWSKRKQISLLHLSFSVHNSQRQQSLHLNHHGAQLCRTKLSWVFSPLYLARCWEWSLTAQRTTQTREDHTHLLYHQNWKTKGKGRLRHQQWSVTREIL